MAQGRFRSFSRVLLGLLGIGSYAAAAFGTGVYLGDTHSGAVRSVFRLFGLEPRPPMASSSKPHPQPEVRVQISKPPESAGRPWQLPPATGVGESETATNLSSAPGVVQLPETQSASGIGASSSGEEPADAGVVLPPPVLASGPEGDEDVYIGWPHPTLADAGVELMPPMLPCPWSMMGPQCRVPLDAGVEAAATAEQPGMQTVADAGSESPAVAVAKSKENSKDQETTTLPEELPDGADAAALSGANQAWLALPVTVRVKVLVDDGFVAARSDWLTEVQRTLARASAALRLAVRVELELQGVMRFAEPLDGMTPAAVRESLRGHSLEGSDVLLALLAQPDIGETCGGTLDALHNGRFGVLGADATGAYIAPTLRCVSQLLGAQPVEDQESVAYRLGSWMRAESPATAGKVPWLDPDNRLRIVQRKALPFDQEAP